MACHGVEVLAADPGHDVVFMINPHNQRLTARLAEIPHLQTLPAPLATRRLQGLRNRIFKNGMARLAQQIAAMQVDLVLCIQGEIEDSSQALLAARQAGMECVSYLALPHTLQLMGAKFGGLRDRFITLSESMKQRMLERGCRRPIAIVHNGIPVIGSRRDGLRDLLPEAWTFETENAAALAATFSALRNKGPDEITDLQERIRSEHALETFQTNFRQAICS